MKTPRMMTHLRLYRDRRGSGVRVVALLLFVGLPLFAALCSYMTAVAHAAVADEFCRNTDGEIARASGESHKPAFTAWSTVHSVPGFHPPEIETYEDLMRAFQSGLIPDLSDPSQKSAFELYRVTRFGDPNTGLNPNTWSHLAELQKKYPALAKEPFRNIEVTTVNRFYPVTPELQKFLNVNAESNGLIRATLRTTDENLAYWQNLGKKVTIRDAQGRPTGSKIERLLSDQEIEDTFSWVSRSPIHDPWDRASELFDSLQHTRNYLLSKGKDVKPLSQVLVNIVHSAAFDSELVKPGLKSLDGMERLQAFRQALTLREEFLQECEIDKSYAEFLKEMGVSKATGVMDEASFAKQLAALEKGVQTSGEVAGEPTKGTVRHLSAAESPFRSCLGGTDCSSRTYLDKALDPNYHYFGWTDAEGLTSGHVTVVLGNAGDIAGATPSVTKVAFVDKIQNVPNERIPAMLEAVRQSVEEKGYRLSIPTNIGDHNGISNEKTTREFVTRSLKSYTEQSEVLPAFRPEVTRQGTPDFKGLYTRAEGRLDVKPLLPLKADSSLEFLPGQVYPDWTGKLPDTQKMLEHTINLKNGSLDDKIRYISAMRGLKSAGIPSDPAFAEVLKGWLKDPASPLQLKNRVLTFYLEAGESQNLYLGEALSLLSPSERVNIIQNWWQTPRYKALIKQHVEDFLQLIPNTPLFNEIFLEFVPVPRIALKQLFLRAPVPVNEPASLLRDRWLVESKDEVMRRFLKRMELYGKKNELPFSQVDPRAVLEEWTNSPASRCEFNAGGCNVVNLSKLASDSVGDLTGLASKVDPFGELNLKDFDWLFMDTQWEITSEVAPRLNPEFKRALLKMRMSERADISSSRQLALVELALGDPESVRLLSSWHRLAGQDVVHYIARRVLETTQEPARLRNYAEFLVSYLKNNQNSRTALLESYKLRIIQYLETKAPESARILDAQVAQSISLKLPLGENWQLLTESAQAGYPPSVELFTTVLRGSDQYGIDVYGNILISAMREKFPDKAKLFEELRAEALKANPTVVTDPVQVFLPHEGTRTVLPVGSDTLVQLGTQREFTNKTIHWLSDTGKVEQYKAVEGEIAGMYPQHDGSLIVVEGEGENWVAKRIQERRAGPALGSFNTPDVHPLPDGGFVTFRDREMGWRNFETGENAVVPYRPLSSKLKPLALDDGSVVVLRQDPKTVNGAKISWFKGGRIAQESELLNAFPGDWQGTWSVTPLSQDRILVVQQDVHHQLSSYVTYDRDGRTYRLAPRNAGLRMRSVIPLKDGRSVLFQSLPADGNLELEWFRDGRSVGAYHFDGAQGDPVILADGTVVATRNNTEVVWLREGKVVAQLSPGAEIGTMVVAPDGKTLIAQVGGGNLAWIRDGKVVRSVATRFRPAPKVYVFPNGNVVLVSGDSRLNLVTVTPGAEVRP